MDLNQERSMRLLVAFLEALGGSFEVPSDVVDNPQTYAGMVIYVEPAEVGMIRFSLKHHQDLEGSLDSSSSGDVQ